MATPFENLKSDLRAAGLILSNLGVIAGGYRLFRVASPRAATAIRFVVHDQGATGYVLFLETRDISITCDVRAIAAALGDPAAVEPHDMPDPRHAPLTL